MIPHLIALIGAVCPAFDGHPDRPVAGPHVIVYGGTPQPEDLSLTHRHMRTSHYVQLVCVNNSPHGARTVADKVTRAIDGVRYDPTHRYRVTYTAPPIEDRDDSTAWKWSATVELDLTTGR